MALGVGFAPATGGVVVAPDRRSRDRSEIPEGFATQQHEFVELISNPDVLSFVGAFCAGIAGILSLTRAKSAAVIGVFISSA
jgi:uncharacterized membrane protein